MVREPVLDGFGRSGLAAHAVDFGGKGQQAAGVEIQAQGRVLARAGVRIARGVPLGGVRSAVNDIVARLLGDVLGDGIGIGQIHGVGDRIIRQDEPGRVNFVDARMQGLQAADVGVGSEECSDRGRFRF